MRSVWGNGLVISRLLFCRPGTCGRRNISVHHWGASKEDAGDSLHHLTTLLKDKHLSQDFPVSLGHGFMVTSTEQQTLLVSGWNTRSQLGVPSSEVSFFEKSKEIKLPFANSDFKILGISCGRLHTVVLTTEGLFFAGCNYFGQCGLGNRRESQCFTKIQWPSQVPIRQVVCGLDHTLLLTQDGSVWSCGWGADGQTGLGHTDEQRTFTQVRGGLQNVQVKQLASRADSSLALTNCGSVFAWGNSEYNQLGFPTQETLIATPTKVPGLENIVDVAIGGSVGLALSDEGEVLSWGYGLLGNSSEACFNATPQRVTNLDERVVNIVSGLDFYVLLTETGKLYTWGRVGGVADSPTPKQVNLPSKVVHVKCGIQNMVVFTEE